MQGAAVSWDLKSALSGGGAVLAAAAFLLGNMTGDAVHPVDEVGDLVASSPAGFECPAGYEQTNGVEPETQSAFITCDNGRYLITKRDGKLPVAFDTLEGKFVELESLP